jgi:soluble lytic murein transglycosylase-like protein
LAYAAAPDYERAHINRLIDKYAAIHNLPASFVHRVVRRESTYNPKARNGIHLGLMQLNPTTARTMGFRGANADLFDAETNLKYGVKYLAGAYLVAGGNEDKADRLYQTGYYYHAKRQGLLVETGLRS